MKVKVKVKDQGHKGQTIFFSNFHPRVRKKVQGRWQEGQGRRSRSQRSFFFSQFKNGCLARAPSDALSLTSRNLFSKISFWHSSINFGPIWTYEVSKWGSFSSPLQWRGCHWPKYDLELFYNILHDTLVCYSKPLKSPSFLLSVDDLKSFDSIFSSQWHIHLGTNISWASTCQAGKVNIMFPSHFFHAFLHAYMHSFMHWFFFMKTSHLKQVFSVKLSLYPDKEQMYPANQYTYL